MLGCLNDIVSQIEKLYKSEVDYYGSSTMIRYCKMANVSLEVQKAESVGRMRGFKQSIDLIKQSIDKIQQEYYSVVSRNEESMYFASTLNLIEAENRITNHIALPGVAANVGFDIGVDDATAMSIFQLDEHNRPRIRSVRLF